MDESNFDFSVRLNDDFYQFANGGWLKSNPLPEDYSRYGVFDKVYERSVEQIKELIDTLYENPASQVKDTDAQKIKDIYSLGMDIERLNKEGASPIMPFVEKIINDDLSNLEKLIAWMHTGLTSTFFSSGVGPDQRDSDKHLMYISYAGLGLGDRDYYIERNPQNDKFMQAYKVYIKRLMELIGLDEASCQRICDNVIKFETGFAEHRKTKEELRDPNVRFNIIDYQEFKKRYSNFDWDKYFHEFGIDDLTEVNVIDPTFLDYINQLLPTLTAQEIKDLFIFDLVADSANYLSKDFE
ncbi:MAG: M13 family metallopeptidase, partial [Muribaculaceae bacterium]|nr:M13 family metallopeptidase [Muribaculaceae bacterium]